MMAYKRVTTSTIAYATRLARVKCVASQIQIRFFSRKSRETAARRWSAEPLAQQSDPVLERDSEQRGGRDEHRRGVAAAVRELAMGAVDRTPLLDQIEDRLLLPGQQPVDRAAARTAVLQRAGLPAAADAGGCARLSGRPSTRHARACAPPIRHRLIDQPQQLELDLRAHTRGNSGRIARALPSRNNVNSTAISFSASDSRSFS